MNLLHNVIVVDQNLKRGFHPGRAKTRRGSDESQGVVSLSSHEEEEVRESGTGILEFSPDKAGMDVTPANYDFPDPKEKEKRNSGTFSSIAGKWQYMHVV